MSDSLRERVNKDLVQAQKNKDEIKVTTLRLFLSGVHNREIENKSHGGEAALSEEEAFDILRREAKKRKEAMDIYAKANRPELESRERGELEILEGYLPTQLDPAAVLKIVDEAVQMVKPAGPKDFGKVMGEAMKKLKGVADAGLVNKLIKERLEKPV